MMSKPNKFLPIVAATIAFSLSLPALADVERRNTNASQQVVFVSEDAWQPAGFVSGTAVPAVWMETPEVSIDGADDEAAWMQAAEVEVPLEFGTVERAWLKALYTDDEVFIRVRWADPSEDRQHHPWVWNADKGGYEPGPQVEDSIMLSFEAGCEWTPNMLGGYIYDFDAWHWLAARSDPLGQAVDLYGNVQDRDTRIPEFHPYPSRVVEDDWILKFTENHDVSLHADWNELERVYMLQPVTRDLWVRAVPDGGRQSPPYFEQVPAPAGKPDDQAQLYPQFSPVKLTGSAAEVAARGQWHEGFWVVEFRRLRHTPAEHVYDTIFNRLVQFSVQIFDGTERLDESSESGRLFLKFLPPEQSLAHN
jgi:hypothetical protein